MSRLLLEVGVEELPSRDVARASDALARGVRSAVRELGLGGGEARTFGTPRRLAVSLDAVLAVQPQVSREVRGPSRDRAYDVGGAPTPALLGFCRGQGVRPEDVRVVDTAQGPYVMATVATGGQRAADVLPPALASAAAQVPFSRSMRWGDGTVRYGRPVAWLVAMLDGAVLDLEFSGLRAGRESRGHRFLASGPVALGDAGDYAERLAAAFVVADRAERRRRVEAAVRQAAAEAGLVAEVPAALLDEVTDLVEWPTAFVGRFPERFLALPDAALTTPIVHHQRQFPVRDAAGARRSAFVGVRNGGDRRLDLVIHGNEDVLAARLSDALFFYERDLAQSLEAMRTSLGGVELGDHLGSMLHRAQRAAAVAAHLGAEEGGDAGTLARVAHLALADRASRMVGEFPELGGVMGAVYAQAAGEPPAVVAGLGEAFRPRDPEDRLPAPGPGRLTALALRAEELVGGFASGRAPTGSEDPYGLRRCAFALARMAMDEPVPGGLLALIEVATAAFADRFDALALERAREAVVSFLRERVEGLLVEGGAAAAVAQAVCARPRDIDQLHTMRARASALAAFLGGELADALITAYRRAARIVEQARAGGIEGGEWESWPAPTEADRALLQAVRTARMEAAASAGASEEAVAARLRGIAALTEPLDRFFREVMVMDPDPAVRSGRLALLGAVVELASAQVDLSRIGRRREEGVGA